MTQDQEVQPPNSCVWMELTLYNLVCNVLMVTIEGKFANISCNCTKHSFWGPVILAYNFPCWTSNAYNKWHKSVRIFIFLVHPNFHLCRIIRTEAHHYPPPPPPHPAPLSSSSLLKRKHPPLSHFPWIGCYQCLTTVLQVCSESAPMQVCFESITDFDIKNWKGQKESKSWD